MDVVERSADSQFDETFAFFGILWLLVAWIQASLIKTIKAWHRNFNLVSTLPFVLHICSSFYIINIDYTNHTPIPQLLLNMFCLDSIVCFVVALFHAKRNDYVGHKDAMFRSFLYSIEGAGTIRTVATIQAFLGLGPDICRDIGHDFETSCIYSYTWRLLLTRYLSLIYLGIYVVHKKNINFTHSFFMELIWFSIISVFLLNPMRMSTINLYLQDHPFTVITVFLSIAAVMKVFILQRSKVIKNPNF